MFLLPFSPVINELIAIEEGIALYRSNLCRYCYLNRYFGENGVDSYCAENDGQVGIASLLEGLEVLPGHNIPVI